LFLIIWFLLSLSIRFTPAFEVELCGHATLATAHVLFSTGKVGSGSSGNADIDTVHFQTMQRGVLKACRKYDSTLNKTVIELDFPSQPPQPCVLTPTELDSVCRGYKITPIDILFSGRSIDDLLIRVSPNVFSGLPTLGSGLLDFAALSKVEARGIIVTCEGSLRHTTTTATTTDDTPATDFVSRCFFPR
jgi:predicted PhzF superfamily epimerase YddE/YHI9